MVECVKQSPLFKEKLAALDLPDNFDVVVEPWPYGAGEVGDDGRRFFQALIFAQDKQSGNPDSNFYAYPLPLVPIIDAATMKVVRIDEPATGGVGDPLTPQTTDAARPAVLDHCRAAEYVPELLAGGVRQDLKPLSVVQPEGPSFSVTDDNLIEWQKWRMRVTFNPREGAVVHDICYDGRPILYRLSMSDMVSPASLNLLLPFFSKLTQRSRRRFPTRTRELPSTGSKPSTLATAGWATPSTASLLAATA